MLLKFEGHQELYAMEQTLMALLPEERPVYEGNDPNRAVITLRQIGSHAEAVTEMLYQGHTGRGEAAQNLGGTDYEQEGQRRRLLQMSFFKAAREAAGLTPPWGSLTGVRPDKTAVAALDLGDSPEEVRRMLEDEYFVTPRRARLATETACVTRRVREDLGPKDIALYVGIPFCPTRCAYCSFVSASVERSFHLVEPYLTALKAEISSAGKLCRELGLRVRSFYMGGGTPTTLSAEQMDGLLGGLADSFDFAACCEYTVEAGRPDTVTPEKLRVLKNRGVTRISVNPQTMEDRVLAAIGRRHSAAQIFSAMEQAAEAGFEHVNMDLIAGLPEDDPEGFRRSLDACIALGADNITVHTLSLKKGSRITLEGLRIPSAEAVGEMLDYADPTLRAAGYGPYYLYRQKYMSGSFENTGWCKPGAENLYNIYIMSELCSILSCGAGGSTKMVGGPGRISRVFNLKYPVEYTSRPGKISENQAAFAAFYQNAAAAPSPSAPGRETAGD
ncbi:MULTISPECIES: coproporphyrinogen dehydrogenase HemZ [unclassified Oscillibacter]|uniref:coproporphyrinogen dehydrogenase HemZ n=1 Tax=unclassified Oscillibacter TaxID=2629304 RepID=UPI0025D2554C|nr:MULTISPECIES: coproporphyrinogen dehydrogenase HemZ [unclassified Oscillibacter]